MSRTARIPPWALLAVFTVLVAAVYLASPVLGSGDGRLVVYESQSILHQGNNELSEFGPIVDGFPCYVVDGRRINSCIPISEPKLTPAIQVVCASGWIDCTQSSAAAASDNSPMPLSKLPWLRPTPRKLKRSVAKPRSTKVL